MKRFSGTYVLLFCAGLALLCVVASYSSNVHLWPSSLFLVSYALDVVQIPATIIASLVSKNVHQPNEAVAYSTLFVTYMIMFVGPWYMCRRFPS
jgi:hypothetical protein